MLLRKGIRLDRERATELVNRLSLDKDWDLTATIHKAQRSRSVEKYYRGVVLKMIAEHTGDSEKDLHEVLLGEILGSQVVTILGHQKRVPVKRSGDMAPAEYMDFVDRVKALAAEHLGLYIPDPGEVLI